MKKLMIMTLMALAGCAATPGTEPYKDASLSVERRVEDLLRRMTLEEKVGQMNQFVGIEHIKANSGVLTEEELKTNTAQAFYPGIGPDTVLRWAEEGRIGSFLHVLTPEEANLLQEHVMRARLGIPAIFGIDAIHGNANAPGNTVYPTNIGLASSFNPELARRIARETAREMRAMNMHWTFNPNVEVARDARWGRCGETFGEDPWLVACMGLATTEGYQGALNSTQDVLACAKHFVGGSQPVNGTNGAPCDVSERTLREVFFPPFRTNIVRGGAGSLMTSHNELNGIPCHENEWLMEEVLRGEWGFDGFVVSDWMDIEHLYDLHATAENLKEAFYRSIMAGMDMHMHGLHWNELVCELVREGRIPESRIDASVRRILTAKFRLGLFEHPYADLDAQQTRLCAEHRATALDAARQSVVLLKNDGLLPLDAAKYRRILVTGINADDENILGDWSASQDPEDVTTILEGLRQVAPGVRFDFVDQGWDPRNMDPAKVAEAAAKARQADLNIVVAGEYMMRRRWMERTCGEDTDRDNIALVGLQQELIERIAASGKPTLLVLVNGRPLGVEWAAEHLPAIVEAWEPGMAGGRAVAEILFGEVNPSAKLPITIPRSAGQIQVYYNHKPNHYFHPVVCSDPEPLYPFGHGLSYTTFAYSDLTLSHETIAPDGRLTAEVTVTNTGKRDGTEIVQLYIRDLFSSVTRPVKELKAFSRESLKAGESRRVRFEITPEMLSMLDRNLQPIVEPGEFRVMVGPSSRDKELLTQTFEVCKQ